MAIKTKDFGILIDLEEMRKQTEERRQQEFEEADKGIRTTVFSLGDSPQVAAKPPVMSPSFEYVEMLKDGLDNLYFELHWQIPRSGVDISSIVAFGIYRRRLSKEDSMKSYHFFESSIC